MGSQPLCAPAALLGSRYSKPREPVPELTLNALSGTMLRSNSVDTQSLSPHLWAGPALSLLLGPGLLLTKGWVSLVITVAAGGGPTLRKKTLFFLKSSCVEAATRTCLAQLFTARTQPQRKAGPTPHTKTTGKHCQTYLQRRQKGESLKNCFHC